MYCIPETSNFTTSPTTTTQNQLQSAKTPHTTIPEKIQKPKVPHSPRGNNQGIPPNERERVALKGSPEGQALWCSFPRLSPEKAVPPLGKRPMVGGPTTEACPPPAVVYSAKKEPTEADSFLFFVFTEPWTKTPWFSPAGDARKSARASPPP